MDSKEKKIAEFKDKFQKSMEKGRRMWEAGHFDHLPWTPEICRLYDNLYGMRHRNYEAP